MNESQLQEFNQMKEELQRLKGLVEKNHFPDNKVFEEKVSCNDLLLLRKGIRFFNGSEIWSGSQINDANIKTEIGYTSPNGSLYLSTSPTQPFFIMVGTTWTLLNIP